MSLASYSSIKGPQNKTSGPSNPSFGASCIQIPQRWVGTIPGSDKSGTDLEGDGKLLRSLNVPEALQPKKHQTSIKSVKKDQEQDQQTHTNTLLDPKKHIKTCKKTWKTHGKTHLLPAFFCASLASSFILLISPLVATCGDWDWDWGLVYGCLLWFIIINKNNNIIHNNNGLVLLFLLFMVYFFHGISMEYLGIWIGW